MATTTQREDLTDMIRMVREGIEFCQANEIEVSDKQAAALVKYEAQLDALGSGNGLTIRIPDGRGTGTARRLTDRPRAGSAASNQYGTFSVCYASEKQTAFIKSLMDRKDLRPLMDSVTIDVNALRVQVDTQQVNKKAASAIIDRLLALPDATATEAGEPQPTNRPATDKQYGFIARLATERELTDDALSAVLAAVQNKTLSAKGASATIEKLLGLPKAAVAAPAAPVEVGVYINDATGEIRRTYLGKQSGRILCKKLVITTPATDDEPAEYDFEYLGAASSYITADFRRMGLEEAKTWGRLTSYCCACGTKLDDPNSVKAGIGPVCAKKAF